MHDPETIARSKQIAADWRAEADEAEAAPNPDKPWWPAALRSMADELERRADAGEKLTGRYPFTWPQPDAAAQAARK